MLRVNLFVLALVLWIVFVFSIERLDRDAVNIATPVYAVIAIMAVLGLILPHRTRNNTLAILCLIGGILFGIAKVIDGRADWSSGYTYLSLFELVAVMVTTFLAYLVGQRVADFVATVRALVFAAMPGPVYSFEEADAVLKRELQYSRRTNRPLSLVVLEPDAENAQVALHATALEVQRLLARRYSLVALTRLLAWRTRRTDFILYQSEAGRLVLLAPRAERQQTEAIVGRLRQQAYEHLGINLHWSSATFPDDGVTVDDLISRAENGLRGPAESAAPPPVERRESAEVGVNGHQGPESLERYPSDVKERLSEA